MDSINRHGSRGAPALRTSTEPEARAGAWSGESEPSAETAAALPPPSPLIEQLRAGTIVDGRYRIDARLGRGGMGVVVAATHVQLHERVALKFLDTLTVTTTDDFQARFRREARVSAKLRNEHIARVIDIGLWQERYPFMVMDHLTGVDLRKARRAEGGVLPVDLATEYIVQVCEGMAEAHALGIVHRDLKPTNLLVTKRTDGSDLIKILDFGISKWSPQDGQADEITLAGVVLGSPKYMAPEQLFDTSSVDARADIWSIGAILYELLSGRAPFEATTLPQICRELAGDGAPPGLCRQNLHVTPALEAVVLRCLARNRDARPASVVELAGALLEAIEARPSGTFAVRGNRISVIDLRAAQAERLSAPPPAPVLLAPAAPPRRVRVAAVVLAVAALLGGLLALSLPGSDAHSSRGRRPATTRIDAHGSAGSRGGEVTAAGAPLGGPLVVTATAPTAPLLAQELAPRLPARPTATSASTGRPKASAAARRVEAQAALRAASPATGVRVPERKSASPAFSAPAQPAASRAASAATAGDAVLVSPAQDPLEDRQ